MLCCWRFKKASFFLANEVYFVFYGQESWVKRGQDGPYPLRARLRSAVDVTRWGYPEPDYKMEVSLGKGLQ